MVMYFSTETICIISPYSKFPIFAVKWLIVVHGLLFGGILVCSAGFFKEPLTSLKSKAITGEGAGLA